VKSELQLQCAEYGEAIINRWIDGMTDAEALHLLYDWSQWARPEQVVPDYDWLSYGFVGGRGGGKTRPVCQAFIDRVATGMYPKVGMMAQTEPRAWEVMYEGDSGILACSPPWFRPEVYDSKVYWPNGTCGIIYTPEAPKTLFGPQHFMFWASEIHAWPESTKEKSFDNMSKGLRLGAAQLFWDSNPLVDDPVLEKLRERNRESPRDNVIVQVATKENAGNMNRRVVDQWYREAGTDPLALMMLDGIMPTTQEGALWSNEDFEVIDETPPITRVVIGVDPATTSNDRSDDTGIIVAGLGVDGRVYVLEDLTGRHVWEVWGELVCERYKEHNAALVVVERNAGGDACAANVRLAARAKGLAVLESEGRVPAPRQGVLWLRETTSLDDKASRARPIAAAYRMGRVRHVAGLGSLIRQCCRWNGYGRSPNRIDALVFAVGELLQLGQELAPPPTKEGLVAAVEGIRAAAASQAPQLANYAAVASRLRVGGGRI
jgi:phage terminase large subunit-like protein